MNEASLEGVDVALGNTVAVGVGVDVHVWTAVGCAATTSANRASTVAWISGVGADVGAGSAVQAPNRATKAINARIFPIRGAYALIDPSVTAIRNREPG